MSTTSTLRSQCKADAARQVRDLLRSQVIAGDFGDRGSALPCETMLMGEYGVSRNVVREALHLLRDEGLIERLQGAGTFVVSRKIGHQFDRAQGLGGPLLGDEFSRAGRVLKRQVIPAPAVVVERLDLQVGADCLRLETLVLVDQQPFSVCTSYLPVSAEVSTNVAAFEGDFYEFLERSGVEVGEVDLAIEASIADRLVAMVLGIPPASPVFLMERLVRTVDGLPAELGFIRLRGDRLVLFTALYRPGRTAVPEGVK